MRIMDGSSGCGDRFGSAAQHSESRVVASSDKVTHAAVSYVVHGTGNLRVRTAVSPATNRQISYQDTYQDVNNISTYQDDCSQAG